jgi:hypothetical protein
VLVGSISSRQTAIFNPSTNTWTTGPTKRTGASSDEESWVKLPDQSILTVDFGGNRTSERYIPAQNQWVADATVPVSLYDSLGELGAAILLPDGRAFFQGATGHTALYTPSGTTAAGTWATGPDIPNSQGTDDAPAAMLVNGKVLCAVGPTGTYNGPTHFLEFDPVTDSFAAVSGSPNVSGPPYVSRMLALPDGSVLLTTGGTQLYRYVPDGSALASAKPTITSIQQNADGSFLLTGTQLNGISEGAGYGDDAQMASNYPIVRLSDTSGHVYYARTFDWSNTGVATGSTSVTTTFTAPVPAGTFNVQVIANGIASDPFSYSINPILPGSWTSADIGNPADPGGASFDSTSGTWDVAGGGADIWNTADQFQLASQSFTGDGSIVARVSYLQNTDGWAKAGVMFRDSSDPGAVFADVVATPGNGVAFQWRTTANAVPNNVNVTGLSAPVWVQLVRSGDAFTASYSTDGVNWTQLGATQTIAMSPTALAGLAVTAHNNALLNTATFDNVDVAAPASQFVVVTDAANPDIAGTPFAVTVLAEDANGNVDPTYRGTIHFTSADPYGATLPADYTFQPGDQGRVTFQGQTTLYTAGSWDVTATDTSSGITGTALVNVQAAPAVAFSIRAPSSVAANAPFDVTVYAVDPYGNVDTNYQGTGTWTSTDHDPRVVLPADYTFQPSDQGAATFAGALALITQGDQSLTVTDTLSGITGTAGVVVTPG